VNTIVPKNADQTCLASDRREIDVCSIIPHESQLLSDKHSPNGVYASLQKGDLDEHIPCMLDSKELASAPVTQITLQFCLGGPEPGGEGTGLGPVGDRLDLYAHKNCWERYISCSLLLV
jgi:hypothetical protein